MNKRIKELYNDRKYRLAKFYILKKGIHYANELYSFDFDELKNVPGVNNDIIIEMKQIFRNSQLQESSPEASAFNFNNNRNEINNTPCNSNINGTLKLYKDADIIEIYCRIPRSTPFINYCLKKGKTLISQLTEEDFEDASNERGLSKDTVKRMRKIYTEYIDEYSAEEIRPNLISTNLEKVPIEKVFGNSEKEISFIKHCYKIRIRTLLEFNTNTIAAAKLSGVNTLNIEDMLHMLIMDSNVCTDEKILSIEEIPIENKNIPIEYLKSAGISDLEINLLKDNGIYVLSDLCNPSNPVSINHIVLRVTKIIKKPYTATFVHKFSELQDLNKKCLIQRAKGYTLKKIGNDIGFSRERIRQLVSASCDRLMEGAELIAEVLMLNKDECFYSNELQNVFKNGIEADCCKYILKHSSKYKYLDIADKFIRTEL